MKIFDIVAPILLVIALVIVYFLWDCKGDLHLTILAAVVMIAAMAVAFFDVHDGMFPDGELSLIYLVLFVILYITGPGRYSIDYLVDMKFKKDKNENAGLN